MNHSYLKRRHRAERADWHANLSLRVHRALSWLDRAEGAALKALGQRDTVKVLGITLSRL